jgi:hypothetical protein
VAGVNASDLGGSDLSPLDIKGVNLDYQAKISDRDLVQKGAPPVVLETTYDRCRNDTVTVGGLVVAKNKFPGVTVPLSHNQFNWFCGNSQESATCAQGTTHVSATLDNDGRIEWNCLMKLPAPGIQYLGTEIDRCRRDALEVGATTGHVSIGQGQATFVEVPDRRIKWWCGGTEESATLPPGTRFVRVLWTPWNNGEIQWQSFTAGAPPRYCR